MKRRRPTDRRLATMQKLSPTCDSSHGHTHSDRVPSFLSFLFQLPPHAPTPVVARKATFNIVQSNGRNDEENWGIRKEW